MHHYPFHPGDYMLDTAHLEPMEDLAYRRLLDLYYTSEAPIPNDNQKLSKRLRLGFEVINQVLSEFFILENDVWKHTRCDAEIAAYQRKRDALSSNGKLGGRPKKSKGKAKGNQKETKSLASACNQNQELELKTNGIGTLEELRAYAVEIGLPASDGESMFDHWQSNGWKNGKLPSKDWKAGIRKWKGQGWLPSQKAPPPYQKKQAHQSNERLDGNGNILIDSYK